MYIDFFRLREPPFSLTPDPRYLFMTERHREGLAHLLYGVQQPGGFVQLTGEIGSGKTTLCRCLVNQLPPETDVALVLNPRLTAIELLATVCDELRIPYPAHTESIKVLVDALNHHLLETHARGRRTVLIIDEAQNLQTDVLEQIRLLTNLETSKEKLLQIILIGQPELLSILRRKDLRQLAQRITARYHLLSLSRSETYDYVRHRLMVAGAEDSIFTPWAIRRIYRLSGGVPRIINIICDRALLGAYAMDRRRVTAEIVTHACRETRGVVPRYKLLPVTAGVAVLILALLGGTLVFKKSGISVSRRMPVTKASAKTLTPEKSDAAASGSKLSPAPSKSQELSQANSAKKAAKNSSAARSENSSPGIAEILAGTPSGGSSESSFKTLYAHWGVNLPSSHTEPGCKSGQDQGFDCLFEVGNWPKLRRYNLPAILELVLPTGAKRRITLTGLDDENARVSIAGREYTFPISELDKVWDGNFILLWKPPFAARQLSVGYRGDEVKWVRQTLDKLDGKSRTDSASNLYDEDLRRRILAFQKEHSLIQDGLVGNETLARLALALGGSGAPSISLRAQ
jgi:general secretion pathway protein A